MPESKRHGHVLSTYLLILIIYRLVNTCLKAGSWDRFDDTSWTHRNERVAALTMPLGKAFEDFINIALYTIFKMIHMVALSGSPLRHFGDCQT